MATKKPRTHKFEKVIVTEGRYNQTNAITGKKTVKEVTPDMLNGAVATFNKMKEKGIRVPAPWKHDFDITALTKFEEGGDGLLADVSKNAGFWDSLVTRINNEGKTQLVGVVEAPGDPNDPATPAGKVGTLVKDTSIYLRDKLPMTDGSGEVLENALMHIALVLHPIERNQQNFELLNPETDSYIAMSELIPGDTFDSTPLTELSEKLKSVCKLFLPTDTTMQNLVTNLMIAIGQYELMSEEDDLENSSDPKNSKIQVEPVIMSVLDQSQIDALVASKAVNPKTQKPFTKEDFAAPAAPAPVAQLDPQQAIIMSAMQNTMQADRRKMFRNRIDSLVESNRTTKSFADQTLYPQADNYTLEFQNGSISTPAIETIIMSLESVPAPTKINQELVAGGGLEDFTDEDFTSMDKVADEMASLL